MNNLPSDLIETVQNALQEDIGSGDITAQLIPTENWAKAQIISREPAIICGIPWVDEVFRQLDERVTLSWQVQEGEHVQADQILLYLTGPARPLLTGERTALNFLQLLSGTATQTNHYVQKLKGTSTQLLDTRKTLPGLRRAQKYAVHCGGGSNHRLGLYDAFLIKENHIMAAGSLSQAVTQARLLAPHLPVEVEVETLTQITEALAVQVDSLLLDNFTLPQLRQAVELVQKRAKLEASGGVNLNTVRTIAETGVDFISIGAITKHVQAIDLSMRILPD